MSQEVLFEVANDVGIITLNRPKVVNTFTPGMCVSMLSKLKEWESSMKFVIVEGAGEKAFCAGNS